MRPQTVLPILVLASSLAILGCPKKAAEGPVGTPAAPTADSGPSISFETVGIAECDDYLSKVQDCLNNKVPGNSREELAAGIRQTASSWQSLAASPEGKEALVTGCNQALDSARSIFSSYGCSL
jgi:hypothetical protein